MKNKLFVSFSLILIAIVSAFATINYKSVSASSNSFYSTSNAPIFYGATGITIDKNVTANFDIKDSRFRVFAKDFEDGDLSHKIQCISNNVKPTVAGEYKVEYKVVDSHNNQTYLTVPVTVRDKSDGECVIVRTIYAIPAMNNMKMVGTERCNTGDRQILGIYLAENTSAQVRVIDAPSNLTFTFFANNRSKNSYLTIKANTSDYQTVANSKNQDCVPLITSPRLSEEKINQTYKIELKFDSSAKALDYYHYKDNEQEFKNNWKISQNSYGVVDGEAIMCVVPFADVDKLSAYTASGYNNPFPSLDAFFEYYLEVVNRMDKMIGLEFDPNDAIDQNYRVKYTAVADAGVNAGAYYNGDFIGVCSTSIAPIFQYGWGTLHEIAHGYQGTLGRGANSLGSLCLNETGNNILAHYIQMDTTLYKKSDRYIGELAKAEESKNATRKQKVSSGEGIFNNNSGTYTNTAEKLYCLVNLFDNFEGTETYAKLFKYFRRLVSSNGLNAFSIQDVYVKFFAQEYNANIIPYLKAWGVDNSSEVKKEIYSSSAKAYVITADSLSSDSLCQVKNGENISLNYGLISEKILKKYNIKSNLTLTINIDNFDLLQNKNIYVMQNGEVIKMAKITSQNVVIDDLIAGSYEILMPVNFDYKNQLCFVTLSEGDNETTYDYIKIDKTQKLHLTAIKINGIYGTNGYTLSFSDDYKIGKVSFSGADLGNRNTTWANKPDDVFVSVTIKNEKGEEVDKVKVKGNHYFTDLTLTNPTINFAPNWTITIYTQKPNLVGVYSLQTNGKISSYDCADNTISYQITENGLKLLNKEDFDEKQVLYDTGKAQIISLIENYKNSATTEEIENRRINSEKKSQVITAYESLSQEDGTPYNEFIQKIKMGGVPKIVMDSTNISITKGDKCDLYSLIKIYDNEDIVIESNSQNVQINSDFDANKAGKYVVQYTVCDSDGNESIAELMITVKAKFDYAFIICGFCALCLIPIVTIAIIKLLKRYLGVKKRYK